MYVQPAKTFCWMLTSAVFLPLIIRLEAITYYEPEYSIPLWGAILFTIVAMIGVALVLMTIRSLAKTIAGDLHCHCCEFTEELEDRDEETENATS
jgi:hypothetical protein